MTIAMIDLGITIYSCYTIVYIPIRCNNILCVGSSRPENVGWQTRTRHFISIIILVAIAVAVAINPFRSKITRFPGKTRGDRRVGVMVCRAVMSCRRDLFRSVNTAMLLLLL